MIGMSRVEGKAQEGNSGTTPSRILARAEIYSLVSPSDIRSTLSVAMTRLPRTLLIGLLAVLPHTEMMAAREGKPLATPEGFGASSKGGEGGQVLMVTRLDDNQEKPAKGSLRWALKQKGPRIVRFSVGGDIILQDRIQVKEPFLTIDGSTAPEPGVCIRNGSLEFRATHDIIVRHVRIRLGDENTLRKNKEAGLKRPRGSGGLDCVSLNDCQRVLFDHCSVSWSCDELFGIVRCQDVTLQWCLLAEPLSNPKLHPYGDHHAFCINASASTLSVHHCLMHRFVMRGPQFECNDMRKQDDYTVRMEAVNNLISGYTQSGSRYSTGVEKGSGTSKGKRFEFQFLNNLYVPARAKAEAIQRFTKHGEHPGMQARQAGNFVLTTGGDYPRLSPLSHKGIMPAVRVRDVASRDLQERMREARLLPDKGTIRFAAPVPVSQTFAVEAGAQVLQLAGDSGRHDPVDERIRQEVLELSTAKPVRTPPQ